MNSNVLICSAVGILGAFLAARGRQPLRKLQRGVILARAAGFMATEMVDGARARLNRWRECVERSERES